MSKNKMRVKLKNLYSRLAHVKTLNYYHQPEDEREILSEIRKLEDRLN